jgi:hypothetical protein
LPLSVPLLPLSVPLLPLSVSLLPLSVPLLPLSVPLSSRSQGHPAGIRARSGEPPRLRLLLGRAARPGCARPPPGGPGEPDRTQRPRASRREGHSGALRGTLLPGTELAPREGGKRADARLPFQPAAWAVRSARALPRVACSSMPQIAFEPIASHRIARGLPGAVDPSAGARATRDGSRRAADRGDAQTKPQRGFGRCSRLAIAYATRRAPRRRGRPRTIIARTRFGACAGA